MKNKNKIIGTFLLMITIMVSCVDDMQLTFDVTKPALTADMEYLNEYDVLNTYVNSSANPNFKLGIALAANDYIAGGVVTRLANSNFHEMTAGNAMKYASCVADDGMMDFGTVEKFVAAAKAGGLTIYGHTLAWHAQQNSKYLNSLIQDKEIEIDPNEKLDVEDKITDFSTMTEYPFYVMGYEPDIIDGVLVSNNPGDWYQYFVMDGVSTTPGKEYKVTALIKSSKEGEFNAQLGNWGATSEKLIKVSTDWEEQSVTFNSITTESSFVVFQPGGFDGEIQIKWVKVSHSEAPSISFFVNQIVNSKMEAGGSMNNFIVRENGKGDVPGAILAGQGPDGMNCMKLTSMANPTNEWDTQFFIYTPDKAWEGGQKYKISFWYKASAEADCSTQCHGEPGAYLHYSMLPQNPHFTTEWQYYEATSSIPGQGAGMKSIAFNLNVSKDAVTYYFANIVWESEEKGSTIPLTPEEKKDTLLYAMNNWVEGMMKATAGYVTAWDVVNEAIAGGGDDGEGFYTLHSASNVSAEDAENNFYWQDYLGNEDYVRIVVAAARKYYAENDGAEPLRLFVNDYNLESDWDNNKKVKSLIHWVEKWESDGVTKIDGIGTQMHVSCYANPNTQNSKEEHIVTMFQLLKESGKLIKITELDMGYVDEIGNSVKTENMTEAQHKAMAEYYKFIVKKYFEIIPVAQQYGITQWTATDSPAGSGWRAGEPVGLWDLNYNRKHTYAGFADGLKGK
jgi:GH35 family endo-1,4-beta-xylanase